MSFPRIYQYGFKNKRITQFGSHLPYVVEKIKVAQFLGQCVQLQRISEFIFV